MTRAATSRRWLKQWLLVNGNRHAVAGLLVVGVFLLLVGLGRSGVIGLGDQAAVRGMAGGFVPGLIAFLSIVLAINQLVLSQEFGSAGEVRERIEDVREYRHDVEEMAGAGPSPVLPTGFLAFVVRTIEAEAESLEASVDPDTDPATRDAVETFARSVAAEAARAGESLEQVRPGRIHALLPVLEYGDSAQLFEARCVQYEHGEALPAESRETLSALVGALELFSVARTQFRTTYTQRVLARLSRQLLYAGLPALVVVLVLGLLQPPLPPADSGLSRSVVVSGLFAVAFSPLAVLSSYLLRVATVSERTIAVGPFVSRPNAAQGDRARVPGDRIEEEEASTSTAETSDE